MPIQLQHKRLVCKTAEKHFDSAEVVIFHLSAFHYLGQPMKILKGRQWGGAVKKQRGAGVEGVDRLPFSCQLGENAVPVEKGNEDKNK